MARDWPGRSLRREQAEFEGLVREHRASSSRSRAHARTPEDRQDLAQEIIAQAWRAFPHFDPARRFSTWMYRIALNVAISQRRSAVVRERHVAPVDTAALDAFPAAPSTNRTIACATRRVANPSVSSARNLFAASIETAAVPPSR